MRIIFLLVGIAVVFVVAVWFLAGALRRMTLQYKFRDGPVTPDTRSVVVMGLAKNIGANRVNLPPLARKLKTVFPNMRIYIGENGSTDGTREFLENSDLWTVVDLSDVELPTNRIDRMAKLRNELQKRVPIADYVCVLEFDTPYKLANVHEWPRALDLLQDETVGAVTGVGLVQHNLLPRLYFYDTFAYRYKKTDPCRQGQTSNWLKMAIKYGGVQPDFIERVGNNFGGVAVYRGKQVEKAEYKSRLEDGSIVCEHVTFQNQIGGDVVVSGALLHVS